jgi:four helix bundle protein
MALITRFEDVHAWQEARKLVKMIYMLTASGDFAKDFGLRNQIQRAPFP